MRKDKNIYLDIRDRSWFVERIHSSQQREIAAEKLARDIVDPYLASREVMTRKATALTSIESQAAFVYLGLQWEDDTREKGLTKLCFEGLIRAVLRNTDSNNRLSRDEIRRQIRSVLPNHPVDKVDAYADSALARLTKRFIRHWVKQDEFCLMNDEKLKLRDKLAVYETANNEFQSELNEVIVNSLSKRSMNLKQIQVENIQERGRRVLEKFLLGRGESFVTAVRTGDFQQMGFDGLKEIAIGDIGEHPDATKVGANLVDIIIEAVRTIAEYHSEAVQHYLRSLSDAYTLLAFLRETPDVQSVITKMFAQGEIWLDTSIILPLFAEELLEAENRRLTNLIRATREAGLQLYITNGVLEEVERHTNRCLACHRTPSGQWVGESPFLYSLYVLSGSGDFNNWIERFRGSERPEDDIADYLRQMFGISIRSLEAEVEKARIERPELRTAVQEIWNEIHYERLMRKPDRDTTLAYRLAAHDLENYLGVIERRREERKSPFGYNSWWLTLDRDSFKVRKRLQNFLTSKVPDSPVLSPDFLSNYLAFGPVRRQVSKRSELALPVVIDMTVSEYLPQELVEIAKQIREEMKGSPEYLIQRKVRDGIDKAKVRKGALAEGGIPAMQQDLEKRVTGRLNPITENTDNSKE